MAAAKKKSSSQQASALGRISGRSRSGKLPRALPKKKDRTKLDFHSSALGLVPKRIEEQKCLLVDERTRLVAELGSAELTPGENDSKHAKHQKDVRYAVLSWRIRRLTGAMRVVDRVRDAVDARHRLITFQHALTDFHNAMQRGALGGTRQKSARRKIREAAKRQACWLEEPVTRPAPPGLAFALELSNLADDVDFDQLEGRLIAEIERLSELAKRDPLSEGHDAGRSPEMLIAAALRALRGDEGASLRKLAEDTSISRSSAEVFAEAAKKSPFTHSEISRLLVNAKSSRSKRGLTLPASTPKLAREQHERDDARRQTLAIEQRLRRTRAQEAVKKANFDAWLKANPRFSAAIAAARDRRRTRDYRDD